MKIRIVLVLLCILGFGWYMRSCKPIESHSAIPEIHFKKFVFEERWDTWDKAFKIKGILTFSFIDGDGDLGVTPQEKNSDGTYKPGGGMSRIHYTWYKKLPDRTYEPFQFISGIISDSSEIPYSEVMNKDEAQNKTLKGKIEIVLEPPLKPHEVDTMRIEFYITDRARNESNVDRTPDFSVLDIYEP